ncbi:4Fe-4S binding domain-containing protein [Clostridium cavendishii DSM 21758]|uniref:4Fe-4S binding domain-containing protein n=1 Tax=Clostridium cavendishii DSM 21758 TaxID=1121302 RepID=A0A1M6EYW8_9CLOT|nr:4Fe-4S binding protein [Clostridium cavendishii]SHI90643.1 4Fe-4S binding domain-containing protein [Clostridium cavendishii DSM 21758]
MIRKIVHINEEKCNGCGICVTACHEGAIEIIDNVAKLISDEYCDGLGDCLPGCPMNAIEIIERESLAYDDDKVKERQAHLNNIKNKEEKMPCGCPGTMAKKIERPLQMKKSNTALNISTNDNCEYENTSYLKQWPVQLRLVNSKAPYLENADLLIAADCTAYAYGSFHKDFIKDNITLIGCPKLDDTEYYTNKIIEILKFNNIKSLTVLRMEVPCCKGIVDLVKKAMLEAQIIVPYREVIIGTNGDILK